MINDLKWFYSKNPIEYIEKTCKIKDFKTHDTTDSKKNDGLSIFIFCSFDLYKFSSRVRRGPSAAVKNRKESTLKFKSLSGQRKIKFKIKNYLLDYLISRTRHFLGYFTVDFSFLKRECERTVNIFHLSFQGVPVRIF